MSFVKNSAMSIKERVFHSALFEGLAVSLSILGLVTFTDHDIVSLSGTMIVISTMAMLWNFFFNYYFDRIITGPREKRSLSLRVIHIILFEAGLLFFTVPVMAFILHVNLWDAFIMDLGVTIFITIYAFSFNLIYDNVRAAYFQSRQIVS